MESTIAESNSDSYDRCKPRWKKEIVCSDQQLHRCFHPCWTAHFDSMVFKSNLLFHAISLFCISNGFFLPPQLQNKKWDRYLWEWTFPGLKVLFGAYISSSRQKVVEDISTFEVLIISRNIITKLLWRSIMSFSFIFF